MRSKIAHSNSRQTSSDDVAYLLGTIGIEITQRRRLVPPFARWSLRSLLPRRQRVSRDLRLLLASPTTPCLGTWLLCNLFLHVLDPGEDAGTVPHHLWRISPPFRAVSRRYVIWYDETHLQRGYTRRLSYVDASFGKRTNSYFDYRSVKLTLMPYKSSLRILTVWA
jgi:hypothetical protein